MNKKLLIPSTICILAIVLLVTLNSQKKNDENGFSASSTDLTATKTSAQSSKPTETDAQTKRGREDPEAALARREMEKEFDKLLPAQFPDQFSSLCDAKLQPGETLVLGGFKKSNGNYEFTMLQANPVGADGAPLQTGGTASQYKLTMRTMGISREKSSEMGLESLISPAKTRIQKSIVLPADKNPALGDITQLITMPSVTARPDTAATISIGTDYESYVISLIVSPQDAGETLRIRTRVESPTGYVPLR